MRQVGDANQFTPFGLWLREYGPPSYGANGHTVLSVTNLDYVLEEYRAKKIMMIEEKQSAGRVHKAQRETFRVIHESLIIAAPRLRPPYDYWGLYVLQMPKGCTMPGPGMRLNGKPITAEELRDHIWFRKKFCHGSFAAFEAA